MNASAPSFPATLDRLREKGFPFFQVDELPEVHEREEPVETEAIPAAYRVVLDRGMVIRGTGRATRRRFQRQWDQLVTMGKRWSSEWTRDQDDEELLVIYTFYQ